MTSMDNEERYRRAIEALHRYCDRRTNPLSGPEYLKLVDEVFAAKDALTEERNWGDDRRAFNGRRRNNLR